MSSHCTGPQRLFGCRVRDFASCFYACRLPLEEDQPDNSCSKSPKMSGGSIVLEFDGAGKGSRKTSTANRVRGESVLRTSLSSAAAASQREPRFTEEEYIVFCFREDGEIDMVTEGRPSADHEERDGTASAVTSRKNARNSEQIEVKREKDKKNETARVRPEPVREEEEKQSKMELESSDSNRSDTTSTSSFAFPVLGIEWIGSPVHMPKSEKQSVSIHCCRF